MARSRRSTPSAVKRQNFLRREAAAAAYRSRRVLWTLPAAVIPRISQVSTCRWMRSALIAFGDHVVPLVVGWRANTVAHALAAPSALARSGAFAIGDGRGVHVHHQMTQHGVAEAEGTGEPSAPSIGPMFINR